MGKVTEKRNYSHTPPGIFLMISFWFTRQEKGLKTLIPSLDERNGCRLEVKDKVVAETDLQKDTKIYSPKCANLCPFGGKRTSAEDPVCAIFDPSISVQPIVKETFYR